MDQVKKSNSACALANMSMRVSIRALKAAIFEMKEMRDSVPVECLDELNQHIFVLRHTKNMLREYLAGHKESCKDLVECLEGGGIIVPNDGGGK